MRRFLTAFLAFIFILIAASSGWYPAYAEPDDESGSTASDTDQEDDEPPPPEPDAYGLTLSAQCGIVMDAVSGSVLYEKNAEEPRLIASTTKIMTALVALEKAEDLDARYTVQPEWANVEGSSMYLQEGDEVSLRALLYGVLLNSGNDAATAVASIVGGDEATFVQWMNEYAQDFGMENTHFSNPHGLDAEDHYSTAHDMARLMAQAMKNQDFRDISHTRYIDIDGYEMYYHNKLLDKYYYCISGKTGYTNAAGRTLVTASEKDGVLLIAVTLNAPDDWNDQIAMYDYAFSHYDTVTFCRRGRCFGTVPVKGSGLPLPVYSDSTLRCIESCEGDVRQTVYLPDEIRSNATKGAVIGKVDYTAGEKRIGTCLLIAGAYADVENKEVSDEWRSDFKNSYLLGGLYPDAQPSGTYRLEGLLSTAQWHHWA